MKKKCRLHPISVKLIKRGHPWITRDEFSKKFPVNEDFIIGIDEKNNPLGLFLHDPQHPQIKARLWSTKITEAPFWEDLKQRLKVAKSKREAMEELSLREHYYWCFGEADFIPGLMLIHLKDQLLIQSYARVWKKWIKPLQSIIHEVFPEYPESNIWFQERSLSSHEQVPPQLINGEKPKITFPINEHDFQILVRLGASYDYGLYTDMAALRFELKSEFKNAKKILNLYSYTGAFSLFALSLQAEKVISVDLSGKYLQWLEENLQINQFQGTHYSVKSSTQEALKKLIANEDKFDLIICDPPSSSSDGKRKISALQSYEMIWQNLQRLLSPQGKLITFLNTHTVSTSKFKDTLQKIPDNSLNCQREVHLLSDCPRLKFFPEGDYLKGIIWQ